jgi:hypothetical protein
MKNRAPLGAAEFCTWGDVRRMTRVLPHKAGQICASIFLSRRALTHVMPLPGRPVPSEASSCLDGQSPRHRGTRCTRTRRLSKGSAFHAAPSRPARAGRRSLVAHPKRARAFMKNRHRGTRCTRTSPLPLLPSGPGGIGGIASRGTQCLSLLFYSSRCPVLSTQRQPVSTLARSTTECGVLTNVVF